MKRRSYKLAYPRRRVARTLARLLGRLVLPLLYQIEITGRENFPSHGPLIVVGNHVAVMEAVLMAVFTPWQVELLGSVDIPHEKLNDLVIRFYGFIPIHRGQVERNALRMALDVLHQGGVMGLFPEGGIWQTGGMQARTGVAWLSYRTGTPVLPIGFGGTRGALGAGLRLERPELSMHVGQLMPAARLPEGTPRKAYLEAYANQVMERVYELVPPEDRKREQEIADERFELQVAVAGPEGEAVHPPSELALSHSQTLAKLLHRPGILKIFDKNLHMPVEPLQNLKRKPEAGQIASAIRPILTYLEEENPYMLTYRFGAQEGRAMEAGLRELLALAEWAERTGRSLIVTPIRRYYSVERGEEVVQIEQKKFVGWM